MSQAAFSADGGTRQIYSKDGIAKLSFEEFYRATIDALESPEVELALSELKPTVTI